MPDPPPRLACVIFDIDGTLTQTSELIFASFNHVASKYLNKTMAPAEITALFGPPEEGALRTVFGEEKLDDAMKDLIDYYRAHHREMASLHPGIEDLLRFLKQRDVRLAVFTGKGKLTTGITLEAVGIAQYFDLVVSGNDVTDHKPSPEGIFRVLEAFSLRPEQALMVGDSLADIKASRSAGVRVASVLWDSYDRERVLRAGPDYVFHDVREMLEWFRGQLG